jgi:hypothetical protein
MMGGLKRRSRNKLMEKGWMTGHEYQPLETKRSIRLWPVVCYNPSIICTIHGKWLIVR